MISAVEALDRLREGNRRFVASIKSGDATYGQTRRIDLASEPPPDLQAALARARG